MTEQRKLHQAIKNWLESQGFQVLPNSEKMPISIKDVFPTKFYIQPDLIGINESRNVLVVEVETDINKMLEVMGKCMLWKTTATYVYIAYPKDECRKFKVLEKFGIGLLGVTKDGVEEIIKIMPTKEDSRARFV